VTGDAPDDIWDDLFHGCALAAFLEQAAAAGGWPDPEATRQRAYSYYEKALAERGAAGPRSQVGWAGR
jgi:hypothetical protein